MKDILIEVKHLKKKFASSSKEGNAVYALKDINLSIPQGSITGIIGMSGAGKSTLLRCLTGLEAPTSGTISFDGQEFPYENAKALSSLRKQIGMVFQHFQLFSSRTAAENIGYPLEIEGKSSQKILERVDELLPIVGLASKKHCYPAQLSGGEKQRVGIARALSAHPRLLLCDEPTSALDPKTTRDLLDLLQRLNRDLGLTIVIITHQLDVVKQICNRVAVLAQGEIVEEGDVLEIFTRPQHEATKHLLHLSGDDIPIEVKETMVHGKKLVRLGFEGKQAQQPVISRLIKQHDIEVNILSGGLDCLQQTIVGHLFVEMVGSSAEIEKAIVFLRNQHVICEVIE